MVEEVNSEFYIICIECSLTSFMLIFAHFFSFSFTISGEVGVAFLNLVGSGGLHKVNVAGFLKVFLTFFLLIVCNKNKNLASTKVSP